MQKAMIVVMLILWVTSDLSAKDREPVETTVQGFLFMDQIERIETTESPISTFDRASFRETMDMATKTPDELKGTETHPTQGYLLHAGAVAQTASLITLYGLADLDITHSRNSKGIPMTTFGLWKGSRLGLKGSQDLGHGVKGKLHLESGFGTDDGKFRLMQDKLFGRQAYLGVESALGAVTMGRQYPVSDAVAGIVDIAWHGSSLSSYKSQFYWQIDRLENSLLYSSPEMGGVQARVGYAFGEKAGAPGGSTATAGLLYSAGVVAAGASLESWKTSAFSTSSSNYNFWNLAASYDLGVAALVAGYSYDEVNLDVSSTTAVKSETYAVGAKLPAGTAGKVVFLWQMIKPENGTLMDLASLRYTHTVAKGTALYSQVTLANNPAAAAYGVRSEFLLGVHYRFDLSLWEKQR